MLMFFHHDHTSLFSRIEDANVVKMIGIRCGYLFEDNYRRASYQEFLENVDEGCDMLINHKLIIAAGPAALLSYGLMSRFAQPFVSDHRRTDIGKILRSFFKDRTTLCKEMAAAIGSGGAIKNMIDVVMSGYWISTEYWSVLASLVQYNCELPTGMTLQPLVEWLHQKMAKISTDTYAPCIRLYLFVVTSAHAQEFVDETVLSKVILFICRLSENIRSVTRGWVAKGLQALYRLLSVRPAFALSILSELNADTCVREYAYKHTNEFEAIAAKVANIAPDHRFLHDQHCLNLVSQPRWLKKIGTYDAIFRFVVKSGVVGVFLHTAAAPLFFDEPNCELARRIIELSINSFDTSWLSDTFAERLIETLSDGDAQQQACIPRLIASRMDVMSTLLEHTAKFTAHIDTGEMNSAKKRLDTALRDAHF